MSDGISIDDIRGFGSFIPPGRYTCRLVAATGTLSKGTGRPMVTAVYEIQEGEYEGLEITDYYTMDIKEPRKPGGRKFAPGLAKLRDDLAAVGSPLPKGFDFPTVDPNTGNDQKCANILSKGFTQKNIEVLMYKQPRRDKATKETVKDEEGNIVYDVRPRVLGKASNNQFFEEASQDVLL